MGYVVRCYTISNKTKKLITTFPLVEGLGGLDRIVYQSDGWEKISLNGKIIRIGGHIEKKNKKSNFRVITDDEETLLEVYFRMVYLNKTEFTFMLQDKKYFKIEIERVGCE